MTIQRLTEETIGKIAAGEVIERPSAVVKELIENALDASARRIDVSLVDGGGSKISVRDDGAGIAFEDLRMAVERHATSKITSATDLGSLRTLGFRGEALSSLAAVSRLQIRSKERDAQTGGLLDARFGVVEAVEAVAWGGGTSIVARDLFENVPARRKFLKQPSTESSYAGRVVTAYALAYPDVAMSFTVDGKRQFGTDGSGDRLNAAVAVWGAASAASIVDLESSLELPEGASIGGIISLPTLDRSNRQQQYIFVQGRLVTSRALSTAFEQAYSTLLMVGRHPVGCLLVTVPPDEVDVNVHPMKSEVRFEQERFVFSMVQRATRNTVLTHTASQTIPTVMSSPLTGAPPSSSVQRMLTLAHPERTPAPTMPVFEPPARPGVEAGGRQLPVLRVLGQVASTYLIAEGPDGMYLIDQHAAHERIVFEQLMAEYESRSPDAQLLLNPATVELNADLHEMYLQCREELIGFGFDIEDFGSNMVLIRSVPAKLKLRDAAETLRIVLRELTEGGRGTSRLESLAISAACHTSIRAGQALSLLEMRELVTQLERCSSPQACGHGRPTMIRMTSEELERQFSRR